MLTAALLLSTIANLVLAALLVCDRKKAASISSAPTDEDR
jgi:hypothetical protein